jgi:hypothetical protein
MARLAMTARCRLADLRGRGVYSDFADQYQAIFIHIPKAAGTSITKTLFQRAARHVPWQEYHRANPGKFRRYFKFAFVRNPWDRLVSTYFFLKAGGLNSQDRAWADRHLARHADFDSFVRAWITTSNVASWVHFRPQHTWICDTDLHCMMDFVGRYEEIDADFATAAQRIGCRRQLEKGNQSSHRHYSEYYMSETRDRVAEVYAVDIRLFAYEFVAARPVPPTYPREGS